MDTTRHLYGPSTQQEHLQPFMLRGIKLQQHSTKPSVRSKNSIKTRQKISRRKPAHVCQPCGNLQAVRVTRALYDMHILGA